MTTRNEIEIDYDPFGLRWSRYVARFAADRGVQGHGATPAHAIRDLMRVVADQRKQMRLV